MTSARHERPLRAAAWFGVAYLVVAAAGKLAYALPRLLWDLEPFSAHDLKYRYAEVAHWFAGRPVYGVVDGAVYPPASHVILWPLLGWLELDSARALWAATTLLAALFLGLLLFRLSRPAPLAYRLLIAGLPAAAYPVQMSILLGQMGVHVLAAAAAGAALLLGQRRPGWGTDAAAGLLLAASLVKPTLAAPLVLVVLIAARRLRPALLASGCYAGLTLMAAAFQPANLATLMHDWITITGTRVSLFEGVPNLHLLLAAIGLDSWTMPASLIVMTALAAWTYRHRRADPWLLLGVAALVSRFGAHGRLYDDALLLLAALAMFRVGGVSGRVPSRVSGALFVAAWLALLTPTWALGDFEAGVLLALHAAHTLIWLGILVVLGMSVARTTDAVEEEHADAIVQPTPV